MILFCKLKQKSGRMEILKYDKETADDLIKRSQADINEILNIVSDILKDVEENKDEAVKRYTAKFDKAELDDLQVSEDEIKEAYDNLDKDLIEALERENLKPEIPEFNVGDTVRVHNKIVEGTRERIQVFEGIVISRKNSSVRETFTVRRISFGVGVEKTFPVHSPRIDKIEVVKKGKVRRAKLYYLKDLSGKAAKIKEKK